VAIFIEKELAPDPRKTSFPAKIRFTVTLADDEGPSTETIVFGLSMGNELSFEPLKPGEPLVKRSEEKVRILEDAKEFEFNKRIFAPADNDIAAFRVTLEVPGTQGSLCFIQVL
jgi:hypothetical protein